MALISFVLDGEYILRIHFDPTREAKVRKHTDVTTVVIARTHDERFMSYGWSRTCCWACFDSRVRSERDWRVRLKPHVNSPDTADLVRLLRTDLNETVHKPALSSSTPH
jgi:hypothetical protein